MQDLFVNYTGWPSWEISNGGACFVANYGSDPSVSPTSWPAKTEDHGPRGPKTRDNRTTRQRNDTSMRNAGPPHLVPREIRRPEGRQK